MRPGYGQSRLYTVTNIPRQRDHEGPENWGTHATQIKPGEPASDRYAPVDTETIINPPKPVSVQKPGSLPLPGAGAGLPKDLAATLHVQANGVVGKDPVSEAIEKSICPSCNSLRYGKYVDENHKCPKCNNSVIFLGDWTEDEKETVRRAIDVIRYRIGGLIKHAHSLADQMEKEDYSIIEKDLLTYQKMLNGVEKFANGEMQLYMRQENLNKKPDQDRDGLYWWSTIYLHNEGNKDWRKQPLPDVARLIFHEASHHFGTHDGKYGEKSYLLNMSDAQYLLFSDENLLYSMIVRNYFLPKIPKYMIPKID